MLVAVIGVSAHSEMPKGSYTIKKRGAIEGFSYPKASVELGFASCYFPLKQIAIHFKNAKTEGKNVAHR
jgi:hypothetical protein